MQQDDAKTDASEKHLNSHTRNAGVVDFIAISAGGGAQGAGTGFHSVGSSGKDICCQRRMLKNEKVHDVSINR